MAPEEYPLPYDGLGDLPPLDEPASSAVAIARIRHSARVLEHLGSQLHFRGAGGDVVLLAPLTYLHRTARPRPLVALRHVRGHAALQRQPARVLLRGLGRPGSYRRWLLRAARALDPPSDRRRLGLGWGVPPRAPDWATPDALAVVRDVLTAAAADLEPLAADPGQHEAMERVLMVAGQARLYREALAGMGVRVELPYLDVGVVETCLATRADQRTDPWRAKPLLAAALDDVVPARILDRRTKGTYDADFYLGLRRHHEEVRTLVDGSLLAARGLIEPAGLRGALDRLVTTQQGPLTELKETLACELWLRTLDRARGDAPRARGGSAA